MARSGRLLLSGSFVSIVTEPFARRSISKELHPYKKFTRPVGVGPFSSPLTTAVTLTIEPPDGFIGSHASTILDFALPPETDGSIE
jgi:hypothetical protein